VSRARRVAVLWIVASASALIVSVGVSAPQTLLGRPGYVVVEGVRDSTLGYRWQDGPVAGRHSLVWSSGTLSLPDSISLEPFGRWDGGVACAPSLSGVGGSGRLDFSDGIFRISEPLLLADGVLELHLAAGELEVRGSQIRYRQPPLKVDNTKANYIFLAGLLLLIVVLMRRVRRGLRKS